MNEARRYALVGTGARAEMFLRALAVDHAGTAELVGLADVNPSRMAAHNRFYDYLNTPVRIIGFTFAANRVLAFGVACAFGLAIWLILKRTRFGAAMRALAIEPTGARLVGVDTTAMSAIAFASGGALVAVPARS